MNPPTQGEPVVATARESAFYQAGFEAGRAQGLERAAAYAGAAQSHLDAFGRTAAGIRSALMNFAHFSSDKLSRKDAGALREVIQRSAENAEMLRASIVNAEQHFSHQAKESNQQLQEARRAFPERVAAAQALRRPPGILRRLVAALSGVV
jgi:hypothetical protein